MPEYEVPSVPSISPHRLCLEFLRVSFFWIMIVTVHHSCIRIQREQRRYRRKETHNEEYFTVLDTQVLADLLMVTGMSKVKNTVSC